MPTVLKSQSLRTLALTAVATSVTAGPVRKLLVACGTLDEPNHRSSHTAPVARGGGIAALCGAIVSAKLNRNEPTARQAAGIAVLAALGLLDDVTGHVPAGVRLSVQVVAGGAAFSGGLRDITFAGATTAGVVNVVNFMDGINGISALAATVWGINGVLLQDEGNGHLGTLGALTAGAGLGFLPHNLPTARLFLGDVGSYALGGAMTAGILSQRTLPGRYRAATPLLLYGADAAWTLLRRWRSGAALGQAHRQHTYQQLVDQGYSHQAVAMLHAGAAALIAMAARQNGPAAIIFPTGIVIAYLLSPKIVSLRMEARPHATP